MSTRIRALLAAGCFMLLTGCASARTDAASFSEVKASSEASFSAGNAAVQAEAASEGTLTQADGYSISVITLLRTKNKNVRYLRFSGLGDEAAQKKWNDFYADAAYAAVGKAVSGDEIDDRFQVKTADASLISVYQENEYYFAGAAHPFTDVSTLNIDPETGVLKSLPTECDTAALAKDILAEQGYTITALDGEKSEYLTLDEVKNMNGITDEASLTALLNGFDLPADEKSGAVPDGWSYWEDGKVNLLFSVSHASGDWVVLHMDGSYRLSS